jgi:hypothetical protein
VEECSPRLVHHEPVQLELLLFGEGAFVPDDLALSGGIGAFVINGNHDFLLLEGTA